MPPRPALSSLHFGHLRRRQDQGVTRVIDAGNARPFRCPAGCELRSYSVIHK
jgi:hypothetical protein